MNPTGHRAHFQRMRAHWMRFDPIGVADFPEAADEYDGYAREMLAGLRSGQPNPAALRDMVQRALDHMGVTPDPQRVTAFVERLLSEDWR